VKKAVIATGGKQYLVKEGDTIEVELIHTDKKTLDLEPMLIIEEDKVAIGTPTIKDSKVTAEIIEPVVKADKVVAIRYKAKKRVKKIQGHRQRLTRLTIKEIV
jgi:large subunit ribosomal protein L21